VQEITGCCLSHCFVIHRHVCSGVFRRKAA
jgi:predicted Fe-S protein YdhL (DUF1289 family)